VLVALAIAACAAISPIDAECAVAPTFDGDVVGGAVVELVAASHGASRVEGTSRGRGGKLTRSAACDSFHRVGCCVDAPK